MLQAGNFIFLTLFLLFGIEGLQELPVPSDEQMYAGINTQQSAVCNQDTHPAVAQASVCQCLPEQVMSN